MMNKILQSSGFKRFVILIIVASVLYALRAMINLILFTFIFAFLMDRLVQFVSKRVPINRKLLVVLSYAVIVGLISWAVITYSPLVTIEIKELIKQLTDFYVKKHNNSMFNYFVSKIQQIQLQNYLQSGFKYVIRYTTDVSRVGVQVLLAILLSLFFLLEKPRLITFTKKFKTSKAAPFYNEIEFFASKFASTFGKVIEAQIIIAIVNCTLTTIALWILRFPQLGGLSIMVLLLGLIPVAGVILSLIPLAIIAYSIGGLMKVLYIAIAILIVHSIETYVLNPNLMSSKTNLPVFYTFIVLIFSEHFFGVWGLIVGIPIFVFILDVLEVTDSKTEKTE